MAAFLDTNILLYALSNPHDADFPKAIIARRLIEDLTSRSSLLLSAQVLSEFISVAGRKGKLPRTSEQIAEAVDELCLENVVPIDASLVQRALVRVATSRISYWDALIVEAAIRSGATILYTEDMHHGTRYGTLKLVNPFLA